MRSTLYPALLALMLLWNYSGDRTNISFEVWHSDLGGNWNLVSETMDTSYLIPSGQDKDFFIVRARNTVTGQTSDWNQL